MVSKMSLLKPKHLFSLTGFVTVATISSTTISHRFPCLEIPAPSSSPKPKHPQHLLSLLLKHPSQPQILQQVHCYIITSGLFHYPFHDTSTCLLLLNNVIRCYSRGPSPQLALHFFRYTQHSHTFFTYPSLDTFSFAFLSHASANPNCTRFGTQLHALVFKVGFQFHMYVQTGLLQMYSSWGLLVEAAQVFYQMLCKSLVTWNVFITGLIRWGEVELALSVFNQMPSRSVVSWTLVIDGYTRRNQPMKALTLFREMIQVDGIEPTQVTLLTIFPAIANIGCIKICQSAHGYAEKRGFNSSDIRITNALIDLYAKCGCIASVNRFLQELPDQRKNLVSWTSAISGFAMNGMGREALETFENMEKAGLSPNRVTFLSVLSACSHGGLVQEGLDFFVKMVKDCKLVPDIKHYGCVIDMLGRAGRLEEAEKVASQVPHEVANAVMWRTLLGACSVHNNVEIGQRVIRKVLEMERGHGGDYVLMSNILVGVERFKDAQRLRDMIDKRIAFKLPGYSIV
ncbi:pentatricopeptide repeat-containing protein At1g09220, mitochondrial-like [Vigna umbellata]|uniref:pentatricopeptide repeat-containing protein At1g09220, mitochondrial-like n=1 Tax=Vigna umbellata TaxID=87088 RepID=UPI001F5FF175|nr:pentatricopeptide repeat-containing protein At1g09220, mitochondrial-like [Vigna umbellata]XP_047180469.1 pentatricopeptide repeat-containing protein At1g09220, mitochondrial-like [Vigna umbellata]